LLPQAFFFEIVHGARDSFAQHTDHVVNLFFANDKRGDITHILTSGRTIKPSSWKFLSRVLPEADALR